MPARLFLSSGDLIADRRFEFARDLQLKGDLVAAADLLLQATELAPNFASAWFTLGEIREQLGERDAAIAAFRRARAADPDDRHGASLRLMRLGAEQVAGDAAGLCADAVRSICAAVRGGAGRRSRLSRPGAAVQGGAGGARGGAQAGVLQARHRSRLRHRAGGDRLRQGGRSFHRHRSVAAHDRAGARHRALCGAGSRRHGGGLARQARRQRRSDSGRRRHGLCLRSRAGAARGGARAGAGGLLAFTVETHGGEGVIIGEGLRYAHGAAYVRASVEAAGLKLCACWRICRPATRTMCRCRAWWWSRPRPELQPSIRPTHAADAQRHCAAKRQVRSCRSPRECRSMRAPGRKKQ